MTAGVVVDEAELTDGPAGKMRPGECAASWESSGPEASVDAVLDFLVTGGLSGIPIFGLRPDW